MSSTAAGPRTLRLSRAPPPPPAPRSKRTPSTTSSERDPGAGWILSGSRPKTLNSALSRASSSAEELKARPVRRNSRTWWKSSGDRSTKVSSAAQSSPLRSSRAARKGDFRSVAAEARNIRPPTSKFKGGSPALPEPPPPSASGRLPVLRARSPFRLAERPPPPRGPPPARSGRSPKSRGAPAHAVGASSSGSASGMVRMDAAAIA
mmetsp:Transcript_100868/g.314452  ORF Transcript_100868/g.314452 Transcript_100868/m.314452 type:complete len:206 (-) Transcript_100868:628-1245(-)